MKTALAGFTMMGLIFGGNAIAADIAVKEPWPTPVPVFTWTACYLGGSAAAGWGHKELTDPALIVTAAAPLTSVTVNPTGWLVGAEWAFSDYWAARLEYDFYDFGSHNVAFSDTTSDTFSGAVGVVNVKQTIQTVKLGLSFRFMAGLPV